MRFFGLDGLSVWLTIGCIVIMVAVWTWGLSMLFVGLR